MYQTCTLLELQAAECITHTLAVVSQDMSGADAVQGLCRKYYQAHPQIVHERVYMSLVNPMIAPIGRDGYVRRAMSACVLADMDCLMV